MILRRKDAWLIVGELVNPLQTNPEPLTNRQNRF
jgi:hypothetical protein